MKKKERIREVVEALITSEKFNRFSKKDIEDAIVHCREPLDDRTIDNWFKLLWRLQYLVQPECRIYALNITKIQDLEVKLPEEVDPNQRRLFNV